LKKSNCILIKLSLLTLKVIHNIPKSYSEEDVHLLARKAANGDIKMEVGKRRSKTESCHLMRSTDPEEQNQR